VEMIKEKEFFWFFVLPFFQKKHKMKTKSGSRQPFINDENT